MWKYYIIKPDSDARDAKDWLITDAKSEQTQQCGGSAASRLLYATSADMSAGVNCSKLPTALNLWLMLAPTTTVNMCVNSSANSATSSVEQAMPCQSPNHLSMYSTRMDLPQSLNGETNGKVTQCLASKTRTRMWANAQPDGRPAEHRWRPLFNAAKFGWRPLLDAVQ